MTFNRGDLVLTQRGEGRVVGNISRTECLVILRGLQFAEAFRVETLRAKYQEIKPRGSSDLAYGVDARRRSSARATEFNDRDNSGWNPLA